MVRAIILVGGLGTRISEESYNKPKPMIAIGGRPILWHIMQRYYHYGLEEFFLCLGYRGNVVKEYFQNYYLYSSDVTFTYKKQKVASHYSNIQSEEWTVHLKDTGLHTLTGGRLKRLEPFLKNEDHFCLTYGDGVADVDIKALLEFHRSHGKIATMTVVQPSGRFGAVKIDGDRVGQMTEKPKGDHRYINGGYFVFSPKIFGYLKDGDETILERAPLENLAMDGELMAFRHEGFWHPMDTLRDRNELEAIYAKSAPWLRYGK